jgi:hypothetical protein
MGRNLTQKQVGQRYGDRNPRTILRWTQNPKLGFPQPFYVGKTPFWSEDRLDQWDKDQARPGRPVTADS